MAQAPAVHIDAIKDVLLSPASCTEKDQTAAPETIPDMTDAAIRKIVQENVPNVETMLDRTQSRPALDYVIMSYHGGLPIHKGNPTVQKHLIYAMHAIFASMEKLPAGDRARHLLRLLEAYQSCQAEQGRIIDTIYGMITGREKSFKDQVLVLVDNQKQLTLDTVTNTLNPDAWKTSDAHPSRQVPHIQSAYRAVVGPKLGLRGVSAAKSDFNAPSLDAHTVSEVERVFRQEFSVEALADALVGDVNQPGEGAERVISRQLLCEWAGEHSRPGFQPHSIYYDEDNAADYGEAKPDATQEYQPFLSRKVALQILEVMFCGAAHESDVAKAAPAPGQVGPWKSYDPREHKWVEYDPASSELLTTALLAGKDSAELQFGTNVFTVQFRKMQQVNKAGMGRPVRPPVSLVRPAPEPAACVCTLCNFSVVDLMCSCRNTLSLTKDGTATCPRGCGSVATLQCPCQGGGATHAMTWVPTSQVKRSGRPHPAAEGPNVPLAAVPRWAKTQPPSGYVATVCQQCHFHLVLELARCLECLDGGKYFVLDLPAHRHSSATVLICGCRVRGAGPCLSSSSATCGCGGKMALNFDLGPNY
mmetsp:Transcript_27029/g.62298  ORF Transcript_27029/g.62298 Transcript_27029/m.62298 type:complete len:588 (+) Transcript_27029:26-1789(+)